jgi:uncharacterized membrane protein
MNLTPEATRALSALGSSAVGTSVLKGAKPPASVLEELRTAQIITPMGNLTRRGSIARERIVSAALDAAFAL